MTQQVPKNPLIKAPCSEATETKLQRDLARHSADTRPLWLPFERRCASADKAVTAAEGVLKLTSYDTMATSEIP